MGAVAALLNAAGEREGLPHYSHKDLKEISINLSEKEDDPECTRLFSSVETLRANYYHSFLKERTFNAHKRMARRGLLKWKMLGGHPHSNRWRRPIIGYTTLEPLGFKVNPITGRLSP